MQHVFKDNQLITDKQWAYRRGYSTELLLVHLTEMCNVSGSHILKRKQKIAKGIIKVKTLLMLSFMYGRTKAANEQSIVFVHQHGGYDVT